MTDPAPVSAPPPPRARGGRGALILGVIALIASVIPVLSYIAWIVAIVAIVMGIVALARATMKRGGAIVAIVLGVTALVLSIVLSIVYSALFFFAAVSNGIPSLGSGLTIPSASDLPSGFPTALPTGASLPLASPTPGQRAVTYRVTGSGAASSIAYLVGTTKGVGTGEAHDVRLPWQRTVGIVTTPGSSTSVFSLTAQAGDGQGKVTCEIEVDGKVVAHDSASGASATVTCSGVAG